MKSFWKYVFEQLSNKLLKRLKDKTVNFHSFPTTKVYTFPNNNLLIAFPSYRQSKRPCWTSPAKRCWKAKSMPKSVNAVRVVLDQIDLPSPCVTLLVISRFKCLPICRDSCHMLHWLRYVNIVNVEWTKLDILVIVMYKITIEQYVHPLLLRSITAFAVIILQWKNFRKIRFNEITDLY